MEIEKKENKLLFKFQKIAIQQKRLDVMRLGIACELALAEFLQLNNNKLVDSEKIDWGQLVTYSLLGNKLENEQINEIQQRFESPNNKLGKIPQDDISYDIIKFQLQIIWQIINENINNCETNLMADLKLQIQQFLQANLDFEKLLTITDFKIQLLSMVLGTLLYHEANDQIKKPIISSFSLLISTIISRLQSTLSKPLSQDHLTDKIIGCMLTFMIGDVLGASVEGLSAEKINQTYPKLLKDFKRTVHMGIEDFPPRYGMYTDDTNSTMALAESLVRCQGLNPYDCALNYSLFWQKEPIRGYPETAQQILKLILEGEKYQNTGRMIFKEGSFANGGAMRISPIGIVWRDVSDEKELGQAVFKAIESSHIHPQAMDGSLIIVKLIAMMLHKEPEQIQELEVLETVLQLAKTEPMKKKLLILKNAVQNNDHKKIDFNHIKFIREWSQTFQIECTEAVACVIWAFCCWFRQPELCLEKVISFGGDTDTMAAILGGILGALHGTKWIPNKWFENVENGKYGRDYLISLSKQLKSVPTVIFDINTPEMRSAKKKLSEVLDPELTEFSLQEEQQKEQNQ